MWQVLALLGMALVLPERWASGNSFGLSHASTFKCKDIAAGMYNPPIVLQQSANYVEICHFGKDLHWSNKSNNG